MLLFVEAVVKTEEEDEFSIDMFDDEFHAIMEQEFFDNKNAIETNKTESVDEDFQTGSDATDIDEDDHSTVSGQLFVYIHFIFWLTLFIMQNLSKTPNQWSAVARAVHQVNNS